MYSPYQEAVRAALGYDPAPATAGAPLSVVDQILAQEAAAGAGTATPPGASPEAPEAPGAPGDPQQQGSPGLGGQIAQGAGYANRLRQIYNAGSRVYDAYSGAGGLSDAALVGAGYAIPAAATAIFGKAAQSLAKPGGEFGAMIGSGLGGAAAGAAAAGMAAGATAGAALGPGAVIGVPVGALLGGIIGGQIGPAPTVGPNFGATGTFTGEGGLEFTGQSGGRGMGAAEAQTYTDWLQQALPAYAAQQGLQFNPAAAGRQITVGAMPTQGGAFYAPSGNVAHPERWAAFAGTEDLYLNTVLGDLAARGVYVPVGTENPELNYDVNVPLNAQFRPGDFQGIYDYQRNAIQGEIARTQAMAQADALARETLGEFYTPGSQYSPEATREQFEALRQRLEAERLAAQPPTQYAGGGLIELAEGGKLAIGPGGGLDDLIPTSIDGRRAAALSDGEFVVPADVVSMMGDGSSNAGARRLYDMVRQIRQAKTGTARQAGPLPVGKILERTAS